MDLQLKNKVALVGASSKGLGKAVALALVREGARVIICARHPDELFKTESELAEYKGEVMAIQADLTKISDVQKLIKKTIEKFGKIDILVTNCGGPPAGGFLDFTLEDWKSAIDLNLMSTIMLCREAIPHMKTQHFGRIIMITSVSVKQPMPGLILSNVSRAGVAGFAKSLSNEFGKDNILVNIVCPGYTKTQRVFDLADSIASSTQDASPDQILKRWESMNALGRLATPEEFANVVVFLSSEKASHLTGISLQIDGGFVKSLL
jgi:3-oxoacyl-[acyl-carrier protein] reductase